jgi:hypothetical protein
MQSDLWQGYCGYWQDHFIRENLLPLGHAAWQGFITQERVSLIDCCQQVQRRWIEFQLDQSPGDLYEQRL